MEYYHFFVDAWRFFKRYKDIATNTQEFYDSVLESAGKIAKQYGERKLAMIASSYLKSIRIHS